MNLLLLRLILLLLLLLFIVIVIKLIVPIIRSRVSVFISWRRGSISASLYLGVLIILVPIIHLLPDRDFIKLIETRQQTETISRNAINDLYNHSPLVGDLNKQKGLYKNSSHTFKVETKELSFIFSSPTSTGNYHIFIERKDVDDGEIGLSSYAATQIMGGADYTKLILPPTISFQNGTLSITSPIHQTFDFSQFNADFTVDQFKHRNADYINRMSGSFDENVIYIRVPKSLEIDKGAYNGQIQIIESN